MRTREVLGIVLGILLVGTLACGAGNGDVDQEALDAAMTAVAATATAEAEEAAEEVAKNAEEMPEEDEEIDEVAEAPTATPTPTAMPEADDDAAECAFDAEFQSDVNVPDGTEFAPNTAFDKTWSIQNTGCAEWPAGTQVFFVSGYQLPGESYTTLDAAVPAGHTANVTMSFMSPADSGAFLGNYQMHTPGGDPFGTAFYVSIIVPEQGGSTGGGVDGPDQIAPPNNGGDTGGGGIDGPGDVQANVCEYKASLVEHITPNGQTVGTGIYFEKKWRFYNSGDCKWPSGTQVYFISGNQMSAPSVKTIPDADLPAPGEYYELTLTGYGPQGQGFKSGTWGFRTSANGTKFGPSFTMEVNVE